MIPNFYQTVQEDMHSMQEFFSNQDKRKEQVNYAFPAQYVFLEWAWGLL